MVDTADIDLRWGIKIPLRDGIELNATVYRPRHQRTPMACAFTLTPYTADSIHERGVYFAKHGLPFVIVDARGRGNSGGLFRPFIQEAKDGYDVVEWLATQPFCNGKVAMCGGSYNGYNQWATAKEFPPHLATIIPVAAPYLGVDCPMRNNIFFPYFVQWLTYVSGRVAQTKIFADRALWSGLFLDWHQSGGPFTDLAGVLGDASSIFQEWLSHPEPDEYWDAHNPSADQYRRMEIPILTVTGIYDDDQPGALTHYREYMRNAAAAARARHFLIVGPWDHAGSYTPAAEFGGLKCGPASLVDLPKLYLDWYVWTMQGGPRPAFLQKPVAYYVMGAEHWRYADDLDEVTTRHNLYFLDSMGSATDVFASGSMGSAAGQGPPDSYTYDPRRTQGPEVDAEVQTTGGLLSDQSVVLALAGRQLVYHSAPFESDTEVTGFFKLSAWISIDCADTDFYVSVYEITSKGDSIRLATDGIRARYREGLRTPRLIRVSEALRYDFERFTFVSRQINRGHRLRLVIAPIGRLIETTFTQKNYNAGGIVAEESAKEGRPVTVRLFHDGAHPSVLYVPLGRPQMPDEARTQVPSLTLSASGSG